MSPTPILVLLAAVSALDPDPWGAARSARASVAPLPPNEAPLDADPWAGVPPVPPLGARAYDATSIEESDGWRTVTPPSRRLRVPLTIDLSDPWTP